MRLCFIIYYPSGPLSHLTHLWLLSPVKHPLDLDLLKLIFSSVYKRYIVTVRFCVPCLPQSQGL